MSRLAALISVFLVIGLVKAQSPAARRVAGTASKSKEAESRSPDGHRDLEGLWNYATVTPLERPAELAGRERFVDEKEAAEWARRAQQRMFRGGPNGFKDYDIGWLDRGGMLKTLRTSLIIDPPDGKLPAYTEEAKKRFAERDARNKGHELDGPENRSLQERCLGIVGSGAPIMSSVYDNLLRIVQSTTSVALLTEMNHETRVIPLDNRPHAPLSIRLWQGDSRGHWEGDTLVVETTNFIIPTFNFAFTGVVNDATWYRGTTRDLKLTERFRRLDADTLLYQFTVDDPSTYVRPWTAELTASRAEGPMLDYACHEGNYSMTDVLAGARADGK
jgi:hypothetical protein